MALSPGQDAGSVPDFNLDGNTVNSGVIRRMRARAPLVRSGSMEEKFASVLSCFYSAA